MAEFSIEGIDDVVRMLDEAPAIVVANGYLKAGQAAGQVIEESLYQRTPERDEGNRSEEQPHLKDSIVTDVAIDSRLRGVSVEVGFGKMGYVANLVEYGHRMVGHEPGKKELGTVAPHPFMRPAFDECADRAIDAFVDSLKRTVEENYSQTETRKSA